MSNRRNEIRLNADLGPLRVEVVVAHDSYVDASGQGILHMSYTFDLDSERESLLERQMHELVLAGAASQMDNGLRK